jgi:hypothetical protein
VKITIVEAIAHPCRKYSVDSVQNMANPALIVVFSKLVEEWLVHVVHSFIFVGRPNSKTDFAYETFPLLDLAPYRFSERIFTERCGVQITGKGIGRSDKRVPT